MNEAPAVRQLTHAVELYVSAVKGAGHKVDIGTVDSALVVHHLVVDGYEVRTDGRVEIVLPDGHWGFCELHLHEPSEDALARYAEHGIKMLGLQDLRSRLTTEEWLEGTNDEVLILSIKSLIIRDYVEPDGLYGLEDKSVG